MAGKQPQPKAAANMATPASATPPLVIVDWLDSRQPYAGWRYLDDPLEMTPVQCRSVGWLVAESDDLLMLAPNLGDIGTESYQGSGFIRIPTCSVTRRRALSEDSR